MESEALLIVGSGFLEQFEPLLPPRPLSLEVLPTEIWSSVNYTVEPVELGGLTLLKGRVSTQDFFTLSNSDLVPGKYEGGLKLREGSLDLVKALRSEVQSGHLSFTSKRLGCGHRLPGIFACLEGAAAIHFQDFNGEVLWCLTIPNVNSNIPSFQPPSVQVTKSNVGREMHKLLPYALNIEKDPNVSPEESLDAQYDIILMAETVYSISTLPHLCELIKKIKIFFLDFFSAGVLASSMVVEVADGSSNVQEVWKLSFKEAWNSC
ncbi:histidine protein methyltransferase 1-like protein [Pyrus ussuriensis x Pyrus communis]|uniref:protein-histidine N-methyltransferase n=1 Tax=Pyrus ussuriensis x Pyrus communis TaxID=2448454 RepID=A0A5N5FBC9_9ROSA|nr:histidine protein methyltransferase 1-like protein [Pyrus ussuriensis x Pyrus communis]